MPVLFRVPAAQLLGLVNAQEPAVLVKVAAGLVEGLPAFRRLRRLHGDPGCVGGAEKGVGTDCGIRMSPLQLREPCGELGLLHVQVELADPLPL